jgi:hypothetical protein
MKKRPALGGEPENRLTSPSEDAGYSLHRLPPQHPSHEVRR